MKIRSYRETYFPECPEEIDCVSCDNTLCGGMEFIDLLKIDEEVRISEEFWNLIPR